MEVNLVLFFSNFLHITKVKLYMMLKYQRAANATLLSWHAAQGVARLKEGKHISIRAIHVGDGRCTRTGGGDRT